MSPSTTNCWTPVGPSVLRDGRTGSWSRGTAPVSGRINVIALDPAQPDKGIYVGTANGGLWKSTDGGLNWTPQGDTHPTTSVGAIVVTASYVFVATGDPYGFSGAGIMRSDTGGSSWVRQVLPINGDANDPFIQPNAYAMLADPADERHLFLATNQGVWETVDAGDAWIPLPGAPSPAISTDIVLDTSKPAGSQLYVGFERAGVYHLDNGALIQVADAALPVGMLAGGTDPIGKVVLANCHSVPGTIYAGFVNSKSDDVYRICRQTPTGWKDLGKGPLWLRLLPSQGDYDFFFGVHPTKEDTLYFGEIRLWRSTDGGNVWTSIGDPSLLTGAGGIHADQHAIATDPAHPDVVWIGNDGGVWLSTDSGDTWSHRNRGLQSMQFISAAQHPQWESIFLAGAQDNSVLRSDGHPAWSLVAPLGDGGYTGIDPTETNIWYFGGNWSQPWGWNGFYRSESAGDPITIAVLSRHKGGLFGGIDSSDPHLFYAPFAVDISEPGVIYLGSNHLYRSEDRGDNWKAVVDATGHESFKTPATIEGDSGVISAIGVPPHRGASDPVAVYVGTDAGDLYRLDRDGAGQWMPRHLIGGPANVYIAAIAVDPSDQNRIFVGVGEGYDASPPASQPRLWRLEYLPPTPGNDATWAWADLTPTNSGNPALPLQNPVGSWDVYPTRNPIRSIAIDPDNPTHLFLGCNTGVWKSEDGGATWTAFNQGLPNVAVNGLLIHEPARLLRAITYGRGIWERPIDTATCPTVDVFLRDNRADSGRRPSPTSGDDPFDPGSKLGWVGSRDVKIDTKTVFGNSFATPDSTVDYTPSGDIDDLGFEAMPAGAPRYGRESRVFVQAHNRGPEDATGVKLRTFWAAKGNSGYPSLPNTFWEKDVAGTWSSNSWISLVDAAPADMTLWHPLGDAKALGVPLRPVNPQIVDWDWTVPSAAPNTLGFLAVVTSDDDPVTAIGTDIATIVPADKHVTFREAHVNVSASILEVVAALLVAVGIAGVIAGTAAAAKA